MKKVYKIFGQKKSLEEWSREYKIPLEVIIRRIHHRWTLEKCLTTKYYRKNVLYEAFGEKKKITEWIKDSRCKVKKAITLNDRIKSGKMTVEECLTTKIKKFNKENYLNKIYNNILIKEILKLHDNRYVAICDCLNCKKEFKTRLDSVISGNQSSCGCLRYKCNEYNKLWKGYKEISYTHFARIKRGATGRNNNSKNLIFDITINEIWNLFLKQNRKCALSGIEIFFSSKASIFDGTASLDRIDSSKGYTIDNVQWVHKIVNFMKQELSDNEFIYWCGLIYNHNRNKEKPILYKLNED